MKLRVLILASILALPLIGADAPRRPRITGIAHAAGTILREEGPGAFLKGLAPRMTVQAPLFGITMFCFDMLKRTLAGREEREAAAAAAKFRAP
jgi:hypothetical protein